MSEGKDRSLIPFAIAGVVAFLCFTAILVMQVMEYMHYDQEPSLWNKPGYVQRAVPAPAQEPAEQEVEQVQQEKTPSRRARRQEPAETESQAEPEAAEPATEPEPEPETPDIDSAEPAEE